MLLGNFFRSLFTGSLGNEPFGSRPEPGFLLIASNLQLPPGEVPEGKAGVHPQSLGSCA